MKNIYFITLLLLFYSCKKSAVSTVEVIPLGPTELKATVISKDQIDLTWIDNSNNESGFYIERKNVSKSLNFEIIGKVNSNQNRYNDTNFDSSLIYHYRVNAFNDKGTSTSYSNTFIHEPIPLKGTFGSQVWGMKNLDVVTYRDGTPIPQVTNPDEWANLTTGAWCYYNNDSSNNNSVGKLYNWYAVAGIFDEASKTDLSKRKQLAPSGTIATNDEWLELKLAITSPYTDFKFLNGGYRNVNGTFAGFGNRGYYWTSSQEGIEAAWSRTNNLQGDIVYKRMGLSVRTLEQKNTSSNSNGLPEWTLIPDINFEKSLINQGLDDKLDGKVLTSKVSNLKLYRMEHARVKDMTGIESFVNLENLFLWDNDFTTINLTQNTKLKILGLSECPINSIDLSKNTQLVEIDFQHDSRRANDPTYPFGKTVGLTNLDLSKNTKMERIYVWSNRLTSIDVSMCPNLTDLWLSGGYGDRGSGNPIENLDLSHNPKFNVLVATDCNLKSLNIKGTANNGVPRTCITKGNPFLTQIKVNSVNAINNWRASPAGAGGTLVSEGWYLKDDHTIYVE